MRQVQPDSKHFKMFECSPKEACRWAEHFVQTSSIVPGASCSTVFDIDDTLVFAKNDNLNEDVVSLYRSIPDHVSRIIVTARPTKSRKFSQKQVRTLDKEMPWKMFHMPDMFSRSSEVHLYKAGCRKHIANDSQILINIGDQWTDIFGQGRIVQNAWDLEDEGELDSDRSYIVLPNSPLGESILQSEVGIKLPSHS